MRAETTPGGATGAAAGNFDQAAAQAAIGALQDTVTLLQSQGRTRDGLATNALRQWSGSDATSFRTQRYPAIKSETATTIKLLNNLITTITNASAAAAKAAGGGPGHRGTN